MRSSSDGTTERSPTPVLGAFLEGWRRALRAPQIAGIIVGLTIAVPAFLGVWLHRAIVADLGSTVTTEVLTERWPTTWADEFSARGPEVARSFSHEILGFGGTLAALDRLIMARPLERPVLVAVLMYLVAWTFLTGGIIDGLARARWLGLGHFCRTGARFFRRATQLALVMGVAYWLHFRWGARVIFEWVMPFIIGSDSPEPLRIVVTSAGLGLFVAIVGAITLVADFARVRLVVEDRSSVIGALVAGSRFARRRWRRVAGLMLLNVVALAAMARLWLQVAAPAESATWLAVFISQCYVVARIIGRLGFIGSEVVFFQGELADATYVASPAPAWPAGTSVESLRHGLDTEAGPGRVG
jgi:hypothetical protein